jgi:hypothetical protein
MKSFLIACVMFAVFAVGNAQAQECTSQSCGIKQAVALPLRATARVASVPVRTVANTVQRTSRFVATRRPLARLWRGCR